MTFKRLPVFVVLLIFALYSPTLSLAQTTSTTSANSLEKRQALLERETTIRTQIRQMQEAHKASTSATRESREEFMATIKLKRQETEALFKEKRAEFQAKLAELRDERKKVIVERIDTKMETVNTNNTTRMSEHLDKMSAILAHIQEKTTLAKTNGKDTTAAQAAITTAQTAIDNARVAVSTQAGNAYVITIQSEATVKSNVGTTMHQLQTDLQNTRTAVIEAKQAVMQAAQELAKLRPFDTHETGTKSATTIQ